DYYRVNNRIRQTVDRLSLGFNGTSFANMLHYLIIGNGVADPYMCLADFESYFQTHETMLEDYADRDKWNRKALINIAKAGFFAADRSIREYADNIWHIKPVY
ncbi:MAG: glycogen/starch/alpha-glucan phosphorylase, partial [Clostridia bacterium]|nr:glycogen/starch/alpha-glucan phosphorylase [Clostridia bacterium]